MKLTIEDLPAIVLSYGDHDNPNEGMCLLEAASLFAGEDFSDHPACVDPVIAAFGRAWNDGMRTDEERAQLKQYIPLIVGTNKGTALSEKRAWMAADWLIRVHAVAFLSLTPSLAHHAEALKNLPPITCSAQAKAAQPVIDAAKKDVAAAWGDDAAWADDATWAADVDADADAAWAAAADAARDTAADAAWAAARDAATNATWAAARDAARDAAADAAWAAARDAAGAAAWVVGAAAAWDAATNATWDTATDAAWAAAADAAKKVLEPTVKTLQESAHELLTRMINA